MSIFLSFFFVDSQGWRIEFSKTRHIATLKRTIVIWDKARCLVRQISHKIKVSFSPSNGLSSIYQCLLNIHLCLIYLLIFLLNPWLKLIRFFFKRSRGNILFLQHFFDHFFLIIFTLKKHVLSHTYQILHVLLLYQFSEFFLRENLKRILLRSVRTLHFFKRETVDFFKI